MITGTNLAILWLAKINLMIRFFNLGAMEDFAKKIVSLSRDTIYLK